MRRRMPISIHSNPAPVECARGGGAARRGSVDRQLGRRSERHNVDEQAAFDMLRDQARRTQRKLVDIADAVVSSRSMLPARPDATIEAAGSPGD